MKGVGDEPSPVTEQGIWTELHRASTPYALKCEIHISCTSSCKVTGMALLSFPSSKSSRLWRTVTLVSVTDNHQPGAKGTRAAFVSLFLLLFLSYTNLVDGGLQAWYERMPKEGVF